MTSRTKQLNNLDDYENGIFRIERNGKQIVSTKEEVEHLNYLITALEGVKRLWGDDIFLFQENTQNDKAIEIVHSHVEYCFDIQASYEQMVNSSPIIEQECLPKRIQTYKNFFSKDKKLKGKSYMTILKEMEDSIDNFASLGFLDLDWAVFKIDCDSKPIIFTEEEIATFIFFNIASKGRKLLIKDEAYIQEIVTKENVNKIWENVEQCFNLYVACYDATQSYNLSWERFYKRTKVYRKYFHIDSEFWYDSDR